MSEFFFIRNIYYYLLQQYPHRRPPSSLIAYLVAPRNKKGFIQDVPTPPHPFCAGILDTSNPSLFSILSLTTDCSPPQPPPPPSPTTIPHTRAWLFLDTHSPTLLFFYHLAYLLTLHHIPTNHSYDHHYHYRYQGLTDWTELPLTSIYHAHGKHGKFSEECERERSDTRAAVFVFA